MQTPTRRTLVRAAALAGALAAPAVARAQTRRWRMVTSWPKRLPGPGLAAERVAERMAALSGGRLQITVHAAGELTPAFEVLDAVGGGVAELGHTASFYWQGKMPAAAYFTTVPFGLTPQEHVAWVEAGGGQGLWGELYKPFHVQPVMGGSTGECIVSLRAWEALEGELRAILAHACAAEAGFALSEMERLNAEALAALVERHNVQLRSFPGEVVAAARKVAAEVLGDVAARSDLARKVHDSYAAFRDRTAVWSKVSIRAVLEAREG